MPHIRLPVGGRDVVELAVRRDAPPAPESLSPRAAEIWRELWREPVAALWTDGDAGLLRRLCAMRERLEVDAAAPAAMFSTTLRLEDALGLTPAARRRLGVVVSPDEPPRPGRNGNGARRLSARERDRILRG